MERTTEAQLPGTDWEREQAKACADHCDALIGRLLFWMNWLDLPLIGRIAEARADDIAAAIGNTTAALERWLEIINKRQLTGGR